MSGKFKFQAQDSFLEYFFWRFEKRITLSEKKQSLRGSFLQILWPSENMNFTRAQSEYRASQKITLPATCLSNRGPASEGSG